MKLCWLIFVLVSVKSATTSAVAVRLAGDNRLPNAGRLEIYYNNTWGTVNSRGFDNKAAKVACYMLGFGRSGLDADRYYGSGSGPVWLNYVHCTGNELSLVLCRHSTWGDYRRNHVFDVSIICGDDENCSTSHPGCESVWNTNLRSLYQQLLQGTSTRYQLQSFCKAWNNCSTSLQRAGCTFHNLSLSIKILEYSTWRQFRSRSAIHQRYHEVVDSMHHLCSNVEPHDDVYRPCYQSDLYNSLQKDCDYRSRRGCSWLQSRKYCYARKILENCDTTSADINMFKTIVYGTQVMQIVDSSCAINFHQLIENNTDLGELINDMPRTVRLAGDNRLPNAGRLEIYYNNTWGTVNSRGFHNKAAKVACYMLGFARSGMHIGQYYGSGSGPVWLEDVSCTGNELSLAECGHVGWGASDRDHTYDVSVVCGADNCSTSHPGCESVWNTNPHSLYQQLLQGTSTRYQLQSFCEAWRNCSMNLQSEGCTFHDLSLSIKILEYSAWGQYRSRSVIQQSYYEVVDSMHHLCSNVEPHDDVYRPCYQSDLYNSLQKECNYRSQSRCSWIRSRKYCYARKILANCNTSAADNNVFKMIIYGTKIMQIVYSSCAINLDQLISNNTDLSKLIDDLPRTVRLAGENRLPNAGRLEIYYNNTWGTVCYRGFHDTNAQVACYMLGFARSGRYIGQYYGSGLGPIWLNDMDCTGKEVSLAECGHGGWGDHKSCSHSLDVSIICENNNCSTSHQGCDAVWNTDVRILYQRLLQGTSSRYQLQSFCEAWRNCSINLQGAGCTFYDLSTKVLFLYSAWRQFWHSTVIQQRYYEVVDSMHHLCSNVEPDNEVYRPCYQSDLYIALQEECRYKNVQRVPSLPCSWLQSRKYCYARKIIENCNSSSADANMFKMIIYGTQLMHIVDSSCAINFDQLIGNNTNLSKLIDDMPRMVRLACDNGLPNAGRLEIYYNNTWGTVCYRGFRNRDAMVACYMLGCGRSGRFTYRSYGVSSGPIWLSEVECTGNESSLAECGHGGWGVDNLYCHNSSPLVSVLCDNCSKNPLKYETVCNTSLTTIAQARSVARVWPSFGPLAGGTRVTITGQFLSMSTVTAVFFGKYRGFIDEDRTAGNTLFATTPSVNETARHLAIELLLNDGSVFNTNHTFEYRANPVFTDIRPRNHLAHGGTQVTVSGSNLDSVAEPRITLTVVVTRFYNNETDSVSSKTATDSESCKFPKESAAGSQILCRLPAMGLPNELTGLLDRNASEKIYSEGPGVAAYVTADGRTRADIYVGLKLDGFKRYQNFSSVDRSIKIQFSLPPTISCESFLEFDPDEHKVISIKGQHLQRGTRLVDFDIRLGVAVCVPVSLTDNYLYCRPPANKPDRNVNDTFCEGDTLSLLVTIGYAHYQCSCVRYVLQHNTSLIVGLSCGLPLLLLVIAIIIITVLLYRRHQKGKPVSEGNDTNAYEVPPHHTNILSSDYESLQLDNLNNTNAIYENAN